MENRVIVFFLTLLALLIGNQSEAEVVLKFEVNGFHYSSDWDADPALGEIMIENPDMQSYYGEVGYQFPLENGCLEFPHTVDYGGVTYTVVKVRGIVNQQEVVSVIIPNTVRSVSAVYDCPKLEMIDLGETSHVSDIGGLPVLKEMIVSSDVVLNIGMSDLTFIGMKEFNAPRFVLDRFSFSHWPDLEYLDLSAMNGIGIFVLNDFPKITTLVMPTIFEETYGMCVGLESLNGLPELKSLTMPEYTPEGCFMSDCMTDCGNLEVIYCPSSVPMDIKVLTNKDELLWPTAVAPDLSNGLSADWDSYSSSSEEDEYDSPEAIYEYANIGTDKVDAEICVVCVPQGCVEAYRAHPSWGVFKNIVEYDFASDAGIKMDVDTGVSVSVNDGAIQVVPDCDFEVYDIAGKRCAASGLPSGVYVVKTSSGAVVKVCVR